MPLVTASETGIGQTEPGREIDWEFGVVGPDRRLIGEAEILWNEVPERVKAP